MKSQLALFEILAAAVISTDTAKVPTLKKYYPSMPWSIADHACRYCFGRVLQRVIKGVTVEVRCAQCGSHALGDVEELCCCGVDLGAMGHALECIKNPNVSREVPHEIMVRERLVVRTEHATKVSRPVRIKGD